MADEPTATTVTDTSPADDVVQTSETNDGNGDDAAAKENGGDASGPANGDASENVADQAQPDEPANDAAPDADASAPTPASKDKRRKSTGGVPEHKGKKLNKKKSMLTLHLECTPGDHYWARLKGYPPWPSVICDEEMLPESLLATRPVSTARPDGSIRDDFKDGGKNAKERTFPIMFLHTNEFQWMVNTSLTPLNPEECKNVSTAKMSKSLQGAYEIAAEAHDLDYFKEILRNWQEEEDLLRRQEAEAQAEEERLAAEKAAVKETKKEPKKKAPRKSKGGDDDVDMDDVEAPKSTKKRKKDAESDVDTPKHKKTPKVTKLNAPKTNGGTPSAKSSAAKSKKKATPQPAADAEEEVQPKMSEEEKLEHRHRSVKYSRHRLQKVFLARDQAPQESEMADMAQFFTTLESYENLEEHIIRDTKIHKVLKAIVKLATIPKDDEFHFKKRSSALLEAWNKQLETVPKASSAAADAPQTNGSKSGPDDTEMDATGAQPADADADEGKTEEKTEVVEKGEVNADNIEAKVEGKADAVAGPPEDLPKENVADEKTNEKTDAEPADESMVEANDA